MARKRTDIDWEALPLGEVTDQDIADALGVNQSTVTRHRQRLGIEANRGRAVKLCLGEARRVGGDGQTAVGYGVSNDFGVEMPWVSAFLNSLAKHGDPTEVSITFGDRVVRLQQTVRIVEVE